MKTEFEQCIEEGYKKYLSIHTRSPEKIVPIHGCIARMIADKLDSRYKIVSKGYEGNKEYRISGLYYNKDMDIVVLCDNKPVGAIGFKFITSNYSQNSNNIFELMVGETVNIKTVGVKVMQVIILKRKTPYYSSRHKRFIKMESISDNNLSKYMKLVEAQSEFSPDLLLFGFIDSGDEARIESAIYNNEIINRSEFNSSELLPLVDVNLVKYESSNKDLEDFINQHGNIDNFIQKFVNMILLNS